MTPELILVQNVISMWVLLSRASELWVFEKHHTLRILLLEGRRGLMGKRQNDYVEQFT
jgi:hypothetical protein